MKRRSLLIIAILMLTSSTGLANELPGGLQGELEPKYERGEIQAEGTPIRKLQRGFLNVVLSPFEISKEMSKETRNPGFPPSWFTGMLRGAGFALVRAATGAVEMVTFPVPFPNGYEPILEPEFPMALVEPEPKKRR